MPSALFEPPKTMAGNWAWVSAVIMRKSGVAVATTEATLKPRWQEAQCWW